MKSHMKAIKLTCLIVAVTITPILFLFAEQDVSKNDYLSRAKQLKVHINKIDIDEFCSKIVVEADIKRSKAGSNIFIIYKIGEDKNWKRLNSEEKVIDVENLKNGKYKLIICAVEDGVIYQKNPLEIDFKIKRNKKKVTEKLIQYLKSDDISLENKAVDFISKHYDEYYKLIKDNIDSSYRLDFLLKAATDKNRYGINVDYTSFPKEEYLVRYEDGYEIWDFSNYPWLNKFYKKIVFYGDKPISSVSNLFCDGKRLWFTHKSGVGFINLETSEYKLFAEEQGLSYAPTGGIRRAVDGQIYVGDDRVLLRYDENEESFVPAWPEIKRRLDIREMEVDKFGYLWMLSRGAIAKINSYDDNDWRNYPIKGNPYGIVRDQNGDIWFGGNSKNDKWKRIFPAKILEQETIIEHAFELKFFLII